jgi:hypothetical protein
MQVGGILHGGQCHATATDGSIIDARRRHKRRDGINITDRSVGGIGSPPTTSRSILRSKQQACSMHALSTSSSPRWPAI